MSHLTVKGARLLRGYLERARQQQLAKLIEAAISSAKPFTPVMPRTGRPFSVAMTNFGKLGWVSDHDGYRYQPDHPVTGNPWPPIDPLLLDIWKEVANYHKLPQACLVNIYGDRARMGLHRDADEEDFSAPVVSISLGNSAIFRIGGSARRDPTVSFELQSGDIVILENKSRLCYHGIDRIIPGSSTLLRQGGRINLTLRRVY